MPDTRLEKLALFSNSAKSVPAIVEFVDIAGLVKGASEGEGLGNTFLSHIREVSAIAQVVRVFDNPNILHVDERIEVRGRDRASRSPARGRVHEARCCGKRFADP